MSYQSTAMDKLIDAARFEADPEAYDGIITVLLRGAAGDEAIGGGLVHDLLQIASLRSQ